MKTTLSSILILLLFLSVTPLRAQNEQETAYLTAIGGLSAVSIYELYSTTGMIGDAYEKKVYEADFCVQLLEENLGMIKTLGDQLGQLNEKADLEEADRNYVIRVQDVLDDLSDMGKNLQNYIRNKDTDSSAAFQKSREVAWAKISGLLGLGEEDKE
jgi:hypothetical protein